MRVRKDSETDVRYAGSKAATMESEWVLKSEYMFRLFHNNACHCISGQAKPFAKDDLHLVMTFLGFIIRT